MTTAEAIVAALLAHGIDTVYALPGVQNDHLFDALFKARRPQLRTVHTRHEQGAAYMALGAALATGKPQAYAVVPGPGLLNSGAALLTAYSMNAPVLALIGANPRRRHRPRSRPSARDPRPGRHHRAAGRLLGAHPQARAGASRLVAEAMRAMATGRPGPAALRMRDRRLGQGRAGDAAAAAAAARAEARRGRDPQGREAPRRRQEPDDRLRRRRAGRLRRGDRAVRHAAGAGARLSPRPRRARQPRSAERDAAARPRAVGARPTWCSASAPAC